MNAIPLTLTEANQFIEKHHRHHHKVPRDKFRVGCEVGGKLVGVATVGQPLARLLCDGYTLEVTRLCTDGTKGVCSFLYSRCARIAKEMGYHKIITYILESEDGTSLKASGWHCEAKKCGGVDGMYRAVQGKSWCIPFLVTKKNIPLARSRDGQKSCNLSIQSLGKMLGGIWERVGRILGCG